MSDLKPVLAHIRPAPFASVSDKYLRDLQIKAERCDKLVELLKECADWHEGDTWASSLNFDERRAWQQQADAIQEAIGNGP